MNRKNFHRLPNPRAAVTAFLKAESEKGNKVYWDRSHIQDGTGENHNNPGVGLYCVSVQPRTDEDHTFSYSSAAYMLLKSDADIEELFTYYEPGE